MYRDDEDVIGTGDGGGRQAGGDDNQGRQAEPVGTVGGVAQGNGAGSGEGAAVGACASKLGSVGRSVRSEVRTLAVPAEYRRSAYADVIPIVEARMREFEPLSAEAVRKQRRRRRAEALMAGAADAMSSVANLIATANYAPDASTGGAMSAAAAARFERAKAERDAKDERYLNYALLIGKMRDEDRRTGLAVWQWQQQMRQRAKERSEDVKFRREQFDEGRRQWDESFKRQGEWHDDEVARWQRQFDEGVRQFNVHSSMERQRLEMSKTQLQSQLKDDYFTFNLGSDENVSVAKDRLNAETVSRIFYALPPAALSELRGEAVKDATGLVVGYKPLTTEQMLVAIGAHVGSSEATKRAIREVAGREKGYGYKEKPDGY